MKGPTDADDARLVGPPRTARGQLMRMMLASSGLTPSKGPTDADDARLVGPPRTARGQLMLMMLASSAPHAQQGAN